jgi:GH25 family lysozyme M1 (1,4-beta-N-acetylmuramidase)
VTTGLLGREVIGWTPETVDKAFHEIIAHAMNGTDVSGWQPANPPLTGDAFSIVKASEGVGAPNANWAAQVDWCRAAGALVGHYHFANGLNTATAEAQYFWSIVKTKWRPGEPLALDIEGSFFTNTVDPVGWALAFAEVIFQLSGLKVLIYTDWQHVKNAAYNWQPLVDYNCGLWGAAYNAVGFGDPSPWPFCVIWQNSDKNVSGGDSDVLNGDASTFKAYGTPGGADVALSPDDINAVAAATAQKILTQGVDWYGYDGKPQPAGGRQSTSLAVFLGYSDSNFQKGLNATGTVAGAVNAHTDAAVKGIALTVTDTQIQALADRLKADLPAAQIQALAQQLQKP